MSKVETGFMVGLKSPEIRRLVLSAFRTATMGAAHSAVSTGSKVLLVTKRFSSVSILSCNKYGTERALQHLGGAAGSTIILALKPV